LPPWESVARDERSTSTGRASITCDVTVALRYIRGNGADPARRYVETERDPQTVGELVRFWRTQRRLTQMELALDANLSTKHLSFVETGRSRPSRQLPVHLAQHLDLPIAERNRLLLAGGFAPPPEKPLVACGQLGAVVGSGHHLRCPDPCALR
jgi:DNA-binding XRE family transcriptional regulator